MIKVHEQGILRFSHTENAFTTGGLRGGGKIELLGGVLVRNIEVDPMEQVYPLRIDTNVEVLKSTDATPVDGEFVLGRDSSLYINAQLKIVHGKADLFYDSYFRVTNGVLVDGGTLKIVPDSFNPDEIKTAYVRGNITLASGTLQVGDQSVGLYVCLYFWQGEYDLICTGGRIWLGVDGSEEGRGSSIGGIANLKLNFTALSKTQLEVHTFAPTPDSGWSYDILEYAAREGATDFDPYTWSGAVSEDYQTAWVEAGQWDHFRITQPA